MSYAEIWQTLSAIDCSKHIEKNEEKMNLSYLSWAWAWGVLMEHYPQATYKIHKEKVGNDGTVECRVTVTIDECKRMMWLPVMNHKNDSIPNPSKRQISDTRMRCLVKCLAMFGLGHYIYAGEDLPQIDHTADDKIVAEAIIAMIHQEDGSDLHGIAEAWCGCDRAQMERLWVAKTKGGYFTQQEKRIIRESIKESATSE